MKRTFTLIIGSLLCILCQAQFIDNTLNVYIGYHTGGFPGKEIIQKDNFIYPALYTNYEDCKGISFKGLFKKNEIIRLGFGVNYLNASEWRIKSYYNYTGSDIYIYSVSPVLQIHSRLHETGLTNRVTLVFEASPSVGLSSVQLVEPLFDIESGLPSFVQPLKRSDVFYGLTGTVGLELTVTQLVGLAISYSLGANRIKSDFYCDRQFTYSNVQLALIMKFKKDKRYFYD